MTDQAANPGGAKHLSAYLDHLRVERRLAEHTLESYGRDLKALNAFTTAAGVELSAVDRHLLDRFVRQLLTSGQSPRSVARAVAAVRGFYRFLVLDGALGQNPAADLRPPRAWPGLPKLLS